MPDPTDIVVRLRTDSLAAADEIVRLRHQMILLRAERDEARRIACEMEEKLGCDDSGCPKNGLAQDHAERRGWDCFKEDSR